MTEDTQRVIRLRELHHDLAVMLDCDKQEHDGDIPLPESHVR